MSHKSLPMQAIHKAQSTDQKNRSHVLADLSLKILGLLACVGLCACASSSSTPTSPVEGMQSRATAAEDLHEKSASDDSVADWQFTSENYTLTGQINEPGKKSLSKKVVLFIHGSGILDRWETLPATVTTDKKPTPLFKPIADVFLKAGFATAVFDKRGFNEMKNANELRKILPTLDVETLKKDVTAAIRSLQEMNRFDEIYLFGHSEGTILASEIDFDKNFDSVVKKLFLMGVAAAPMHDTIQYQFVTQPVQWVFAALDRNHNDRIETSGDQNEFQNKPDTMSLPLPLLDPNKRGYFTREELRHVLQSQFETIDSSIREASPTQLVAGKAAGWWQQMFARPSLVARAKLYRHDVVIVHGESDRQVPFETNALALTEALQKNHKHVKLLRFKGYGHSLSPNQDDGPALLGAVQTGVLQALANEISQNK